MTYPCPYCSSEFQKISHGGLCPKVKRIEYYPDGQIKEIEFKDFSDAPATLSIAVEIPKEKQA